jgi:hypothetical protein
LLQLEEDDVLFLAGRQQVLVGHALLDQLAGEPRDLLISELDGRLRILKRGALLLELALCFLPRRAFALKGGMGLLMGGLLLLEPGLYRLAVDGENPST